MQPVGRRTLAESLGLTERVLRSETDLLKGQGMITTTKSGMSLTEKGIEILKSAETMMDQFLGMDQIEQKMAEHFGIDRCLIAPGNLDEMPMVIEQLGEFVNDTLDHLLPEGRNIIAVMGGTTMASVANHLTNLENDSRHNIFVPARGGIGGSVVNQANTVSAQMAANSNGDFQSLFVPEQLSAKTYDTLIKEPSILEVLNLIREANCVIHSIGRAIHMAARRKMTESELVMLRQKHAVAESFGYFFDEAGEVVYKVPRIGLELTELEKVPVILAVAGGKSKAKAINAYMKHAPKQTWLITDEAVANEILKGVTL
jgi:central glycolytic genes regulator